MDKVGCFTKRHFSKKFMEFFLFQPAPGDTGKPCGIDYEMKVSPLRIISVRFFNFKFCSHVDWYFFALGLCGRHCGGQAAQKELGATGDKKGFIFCLMDYRSNENGPHFKLCPKKLRWMEIAENLLLKHSWGYGDLMIQGRLLSC